MHAVVFILAEYAQIRTSIDLLARPGRPKGTELVCFARELRAFLSAEEMALHPGLRVARSTRRALARNALAIHRALDNLPFAIQVGEHSSCLRSLRRLVSGREETDRALLVDGERRLGRGPVLELGCRVATLFRRALMDVDDTSNRTLPTYQ
jgi:hypothetical protein